jgi:hypothetical protein
VKTQLLDLQDPFGSVNVRERLAGAIADRRGWRPVRRVTVLAVANTATNRPLVRDHPSLFAAFVVRRLTLNALHRNERITHWVNPGTRDSWLAGRQRVRRRRANSHDLGRTSPEVSRRTDAGG